jgi:hypothetical protein
VLGIEQYRGYLQFNHMPAEVRDGAPQNITQAELVLTPSYKHLPKYEHDTDYNLDWDSIDMAFDIQLWDMDLCNDPAVNANCFTLKDNRTLTNQAVFNWGSKPAGVNPYNLFTLTIGPYNKDGGNKKEARVDVTDRVRWWYQNRPAHGPGWVLERKPNSISGQCDFAYEYLIIGWAPSGPAASSSPPCSARAVSRFQRPTTSASPWPSPRLARPRPPFARQPSRAVTAC